MTGPPLLRVVRGEPTDEELAAVVTVVAAVLARAAAAGERAAAPRSAWGHP
ncbi:MAG: acyl-CoA carboxylase subunit epsilon, partial [Nocardioidaceae bacterium]|nr:acyl-CoA carboxylase subunit epsilon [Nocardioidaceae bacterium]